MQNVEISSKKAKATTTTDSLGQFYLVCQQEDLSYGVSHLENENHEFCSYSDIFELIRGQLSGVTVSNNEVYVVDNQTFSSIEWIQPCQVKSINVLKDSNAAIYGTNGGNGVVLIETMK